MNLILTQNLLKNLLDQLNSQGLFPIMGAEIEFYASKPLENIDLNLDFLLEKEKGLNQYEVKTTTYKNISLLAQEIINIKEKIISAAKLQNITIDFSAKPFTDQPGNALHIHLNLIDINGVNLYSKKDGSESEILLYSIGGLCSTMAENMLLFAPYPEAYLRYEGGLESPSKICWGANNRSCAIRIPLNQNFNRRLEHRVACADANPFEVISAILFGIMEGIKKKIIPPEKLYGNAFLEQYSYTKLPQNLDEAKSLSKVIMLN